MVSVAQILPEAKKIVGNHDLQVVFRKITQAAELLLSKGEFDSVLGTLDICVHSRVVTLPSEVETVLAVNMVGQPALGRDELYQFHIDGPGTCGAPVRYEWLHGSEAPVFRELACPSVLRAYARVPEDAGAELWVYGYNTAQEYIRTPLGNGNYRDGWRVPVFAGVGTSAPDAPEFARIVAVTKAVTRGPIRLTAVQGNDEITIAMYQSYETVPKFRRIVLSENVPWVRIRYRKRLQEVRSEDDLLPVPGAMPLLAMLRAVKAYDVGNVPEGEAYEATAIRWATEIQNTKTAPVAHPVQVSIGDSLLAPGEWLE